MYQGQNQPDIAFSIDTNNGVGDLVPTRHKKSTLTKKKLIKGVGGESTLDALLIHTLLQVHIIKICV